MACLAPLAWRVERLRRGLRRMIELDISGVVAVLEDSDARRLRDAAANEAGRSPGHRDLSLLLDRALATRKRIALQRGEKRALEELLAGPEFSALRVQFPP